MLTSYTFRYAAEIGLTTSTVHAACSWNISMLSLQLQSALRHGSQVTSLHSARSSSYFKLAELAERETVLSCYLRRLNTSARATFGDNWWPAGEVVEEREQDSVRRVPRSVYTHTLSTCLRALFMYRSLLRGGGSRISWFGHEFPFHFSFPPLKAEVRRKDVMRRCLGGESPPFQSLLFHFTLPPFSFLFSHYPVTRLLPTFLLFISDYRKKCLHSR